VDIVERRIGRRCTKDLFGFIDLIAISPEGLMVGIQVTSGNCFREHRDKLSEDKELVHNMTRWMATGAELHAHIWRNRKAGRVCETYEIDEDMDWLKTGEESVVGQSIR